MRKDIEANYTKDEFISKYHIKKNDFKNDIETFLNYFDIDKERLKRDSNEEGNYEIPYEISDLLSLMFTYFKDSPFYDKRYNLNTKNTDFTLNYVNKILSEIETLPDYLKYNIKKNPSYLFNLNLSQIIPILIDKFTALLVLIGSRSDVSAGNQLVKLTKELDKWINNYCLHDQMLELNKNSKIPILNIDDTGALHPHGKYNYNIDSILSLCLTENLRHHTTDLPHSIPDDLKDSLLNITNKGVKRKKPSEDELLQIRNEYNKFLNTLVNKDHFSKIIADIDNNLKNNSNLSFIYTQGSISEIKTILYTHFTTYILPTINPKFFNSDNDHIEPMPNLALNIIPLTKYFNRMAYAHKKDYRLKSEKNLRKELKKCASEIFHLQNNIYNQKLKLFEEINSNTQYNLIKQSLNNQLAQVLFLSMK
ncbi:hypothetical protein [Clostridium beijerinckii]|uniref:hypothetical protein n=1 Tax=Clostridium beijerinckii TaxID=1520 RepID=UPI00098CE917|nr:hypothetical protein [Clostridium beijerinckii]NRT78406.1 hypothetical protein [Clostridium beijerinckii]OOM47287.1 hypothetical protein CBEIJ_28530 [Clostridium beijerinckii]